MLCLNFADSRSGVSHLRTPTRTLATATGVCLAPPTPPSPHERGANLTIPPCLAAQEASSTFILTIPNGRRHPRQLQVRPAARSVCLGLRSACAAQHCLRAAGPRAIPSTVADEPGPLGYLLFVNVLAVPASLLARVVCRVEVSGFVLCASRVGSVCMCC